MRRILLIVVPVLLLCAVVGVMVAFRIPPHDGDGEFQATPIWYGPMPNRGYTITFPEFDIGSRHRVTYKFSNLTDLGKACGLYLAIVDPGDDLIYGELRELAEKRYKDAWTERVTKQVAGRLTLHLKGSEGTSLRVSGRLGKYDWAREGDRHVLYHPKKSFFTPVPGEEYTLKVSYSPDRRLKDRPLLVYIATGEPSPAREILPDKPDPEPAPEAAPEPEPDVDPDLGMDFDDPGAAADPDPAG